MQLCSPRRWISGGIGWVILLYEWIGVCLAQYVIKGKAYVAGKPFWQSSPTSEARQSSPTVTTGLPRRFAPRNEDLRVPPSITLNLADMDQPPIPPRLARGLALGFGEGVPRMRELRIIVITCAIEERVTI